MALFTHLTEASIYQIEFNISKRNYSSLNQIIDYFIQTSLHFFSKNSIKNKYFLI